MLSASLMDGNTIRKENVMHEVYFVNMQTSLQKPSYTESMWETYDDAVECIRLQGFTKVSDNLWELRNFYDGHLIRFASISKQLLP